jgi:ankyrin repeat protein
MTISSFLGRRFRTPIHRLATVTLFALAWSSFVFCGEIHDAAKQGDLAKVNALLKGHPDLVSSKANDGRTPLHMAAEAGHKNVAELLLANKAKVNAKDSGGFTPLHFAALYGRKDVAEYLLANKAKVNAKDNGGFTPLQYATKEGHKDVVELLRRHGGHE